MFSWFSICPLMELYRLYKLASASTPVNSPLRSAKMESVCSISRSVQPKSTNAVAQKYILFSFIAFIEFFLKSCTNAQGYGSCSGEGGIIDAQGRNVVQGLRYVHLGVKPGIIGDDEQVLSDQGQSQVLDGPISAHRYIVAQGSALQPQEISLLQKAGRNIGGIGIGLPIGQYILGYVLAHPDDPSGKEGIF